MPANTFLRLAFIVLMAGASTAVRAKDFHHVIRYTFDLKGDLTYQQTTTQDIAVLSERAVGAYSQIAINFSPKSQRLDVLEAWIEQPDGTRLTVPPENTFTRSSAASRDAPGFTDQETLTIVFPQVEIGSRLHLKTNMQEKTPPLLGFNAVLTAPVGGSIDLAAVVTAPKSAKVQWRQRGDFQIRDTTQNDVQTISVQFSEDDAGPAPEPHMVSPLDVQPVFVATTLSGYEQIGSIYAAQNAGKAAVTPEIRQLAQYIAGDKTGIEAARAVYDWVAGHIRYLAVYLDPAAGYVAHSAPEILQKGYGDCKDHVVIMQALLAALGIAAEPALVNWDNRMKPLPLASAAAFNHVMIYLPEFDLYANPTNGYARFGTLDLALSNKLVVIAGAEPSLRQTPQSPASDNRYDMAASLTLAPDGTISGENTIGLSARIDSTIRKAVAEADSPQALADRLVALTPEGGFGRMTASNPRNLDIPFSIRTQWNSPHGIITATPRVAFSIPVGIDLLPYTTFRQYLSPTGARRFPLLMGAQRASWRYEVALPEGARLETAPVPVSLFNAAGSYRASYDASESGTIKVARELVLQRDIYEPQDYPALQTLLYGLIDDARTPLFLKTP